MIKSILIAFTGSTGPDALWDLTTKTLELIDPTFELLAVGGSEQEARRLHEQAQALEDRLVSADVRATMSSMGVGTLKDVALRHAARSNPSLVVLCGEATFEPGESGIPLLIVRPNRTSFWTRRVLVVMDDQPESASVVRAVASLCRGSPCAMILIYLGAQRTRPKHVELALRRLEAAGFYALLRHSNGDPLGALRDELAEADLVATSPARQRELCTLLGDRPVLLGGHPARAGSSARR